MISLIQAQADFLTTAALYTAVVKNQCMTVLSLGGLHETPIGPSGSCSDVSPFVDQRV